LVLAKKGSLGQRFRVLVYRSGVGVSSSALRSWQNGTGNAAARSASVGAA
jgi:hypothetical protein